MCKERPSISLYMLYCIRLNVCLHSQDLISWILLQRRLFFPQLSDPRCGKFWCYVDPCACAISEPPKVQCWFLLRQLMRIWPEFFLNRTLCTISICLHIHRSWLQKDQSRYFMESMGCFGMFPECLDPHLCDFWRSLHTFRKVPLGRNLFTTPMRLGIASLEGHVGVCTCNLSIGGIEHFLKWSIPRWKQLQYRWVAWVEVWRFRQVPGIGTNFVPWKDSVC